jgi:hypothetical protein
MLKTMDAMPGAKDPAAEDEAKADDAGAWTSPTRD